MTVPYLCQVRDDFPALHSGIVVLINQKGLNHHQDLVETNSNQISRVIDHPQVPRFFVLHNLGFITYLVHVGSNKVVQFVEDAVDDFDQQMTLLVL